MVNTAAKHIAQEGRDHASCSTNDVAEKLKTIHDAMDHSGEEIEQLLQGMPDRQRLIARVLMARDFYHTALAHVCYLRGLPQETGHAELRPEEMKPGEPLPVLPFNEWLFPVQGRPASHG